MPEDLDPEQGEYDHDVPMDLLTLHEVLDWEAGTPAYRTLSARSIAPKTTAIKLVTRAEWGARAPEGITRLDNPGGVTFHYEGPHMGEFPHDSCASKVRGIQKFHMDVRGWTDGAYNFIVCPHGYVFVMRGNDVRSAANGTNTGNSSSHAICALIGENDRLTPELIIGLLDARDYMMFGGTGARVWSHRDWKATACPGSPIHNWVQSGMPRPGVTPPAPTPTPTPPVDPAKCYESHPLLKRGDVGSRVNHLQYLLNRTGAALVGDGIFGVATENAVRNFQTWAKITSDGICGSQTWTTLHRHVDGLVI